MKWMNVVLAGIFMVGSSAWAASSMEWVENKSFRVGVQAGATFNDLDSPSDIKTQNRAGLAAGLNAQIPLGEYVSLQPEALFVQRSVELSRVGNINVVAKHNSIEVPVFIKAHLNSEVSPYLFVGPVAIFNISKSVEANTPAGSTAIEYNPKTFEFAAAGGLGVDVGPFFANARYVYGLTDANEKSAQFHMRGIHLLAGLRI